MSDLIAVAFDDPAIAFLLRAELVAFQSAHLIDMEDIVVLTRGADGKVRLHQAIDLTAAGASGGGFWVTLIGTIFLNPLLDAAASAASAASAGGADTGARGGRATDLGISETMTKAMGEGLPAGGSAVFLLARSATGDAVLERLDRFGAEGRVLRTTLDDEGEQALRRLFDTPATA